MTLEEQYKQETGKNAFCYNTTNDFRKFAYIEYVYWLQSIITLAVERFRAGEKVIEYHNKRMGEENLAMTYDEWKHAVSAYEAAVKGEGE